MKTKRQRKPAEPIKVLGPHNRAKDEEKSPMGVDMAQLWLFKRQDDGSVKFVDDPNGMWRLIKLP